MNPEDPNFKDARLSSLLREGRAKSSLPPRFREGVWRRIEESEIASTARVGWLDSLATWVLRPRFALAVAVVLICAGSVFGAFQGTQAKHEHAQSLYLSAVAPSSLR